MLLCILLLGSTSCLFLVLSRLSIQVFVSFSCGKFRAVPGLEYCLLLSLFSCPWRFPTRRLAFGGLGLPQPIDTPQQLLRQELNAEVRAKIVRKAAEIENMQALPQSGSPALLHER